MPMWKIWGEKIGQWGHYDDKGIYPQLSPLFPQALWKNMWKNM